MNVTRLLTFCAAIFLAVSLWQATGVLRKEIALTREQLTRTAESVERLERQLRRE